MTSENLPAVARDFRRVSQQFAGAQKRRPAFTIAYPLASRLAGKLLY
jgi:hypothetical protein